ncbi:AMP-binding protein [Pelagibius sp. Alg239-R121]|uniref:AMP-binding protein n=1 Tax=Pelagibius sp. Alg239-R121 TaxID=2993448 RepID=UPI0024A6E083|nr:AMP-binding protein [Pelagibius sp. Alg239-R121]
MTGSPLSSAALYDGIVASGKAEFLVQTDGVLRYDQFLRDLHGCCGLFDTRDLTPGERVLIVTADEAAAITAFTAALLDGLVPVMLTPDTPAPRAGAVARKVSPGLIVADAARCAEDWIEDWLEDRAGNAVPVMQTAKGFFGAKRLPKSGFQAEIAVKGRAPRLPEDQDALAYILFTSGTTSAPKGAVITHRNLFSHLDTLSRLFGYDKDSRIFNGMVLAHGDGLVQGPLLALANACALIRPAPYSAAKLEDWLNSIRAFRATHVLSVPTIYAFIDRYAAHDDYFDAAECQCLISVAAKLDEALWRRLETRFSRPVFNQYGLTETVASALYAGPHPEMGATGTIGKPVDIKVRLVGQDGGDVPDGETGEVWLSGDNVFSGYWDDAEQTAEVLSGDGWLRTGDLAVKRPDGAFEIRGRIKTAIMCGGFLIQPSEVDEVLMTHPAVSEAATVGISDSDFGEIPASAVVLDGAFDEAALSEHCRARLEPMKVPKRIVAVEAIPRGDAGKPQLEALRVLLVAGTPVASLQSSLTEAVLEIASRTFRIPVDSLSPDSGPEDVSGWDSFAHINLVLQVEQSFGLRIPTAEVVSIARLADLIAAVERLK